MADHARTAIIGGGVGRTSIVYHLAGLGWYRPPDRAIGTRGNVEVSGEWIGFEVVRDPLYGPTGERIRA